MNIGDARPPTDVCHAAFGVVLCDTPEAYYSNTRVSVSMIHCRVIVGLLIPSHIKFGNRINHVNTFYNSPQTHFVGLAENYVRL